MQSKKFCFSINKAILKHNMKSSWPVSLLYLIYLMMFVTLHMSMTITDVIYQYSDMSGRQEWMRQAAARSCLVSTTEPISVMIVAVMAVLCTFGYLYNSRKGNMIHSFPVTKDILFVTNLLSAFLLLLIPQIITFGVTFAAAGLMGVNIAGGLAIWLVYEILYSMFFVGFAAFIAMFTGQGWVVVLFYMAFNAVYAWASVMWRVLTEMVSSDLIMSDVTNPELYSIFTPVLYLVDKTGFALENTYKYGAYPDNLTGHPYSEIIHPTGFVIALIYAGVGLLFAAAALWVYKKRANERSGDFLSIPVTKPLFRFCTGVFGGAAAGMFIAYIFFDTRNMENLFFAFLVILFVCLSYCVAEMFVKKSYRIFSKRFFAETAICVVCVCAVMGYSRFSAIQSSKYVPDPAHVSWIGVDGDYIIATSKDDRIKSKILDINQFVVDNYDSLMAQMKDSRNRAVYNIDDWEYYSVRIKFEMDDGKTFFKDLWFYCEDDDRSSTGYELYAMCKELHNDPECFKHYLFTEQYRDLEVDNVSCHGTDYYEQVDDNGNTTSIDLMVYAVNYISANKDLRQKFYEAILKDIDSGNVDYVSYPDSEEVYELGFDFSSKYGEIYDTSRYFWGNSTSSKDYNVNVYITDKYENTTKFLQDVLDNAYNDAIMYQENYQYWNE